MHFVFSKGQTKKNSSIFSTFQTPPFGWKEHIIYLDPQFDLYFWRSTPQNKAFYRQNKGHLCSRYLYIPQGVFFEGQYFQIFPLLQHRNEESELCADMSLKYPC